MTNQTPWAELSDDQKRPYDDYVFSQCYFYADTHYSPATVEVLHRFAEHVYTHKTWQPPEHPGLAVVREAVSIYEIALGLPVWEENGVIKFRYLALERCLAHIVANGFVWEVK